MDFKVCVLLAVLLSNSNVFAARQPQGNYNAIADCSIDVRSKETDTRSPVLLHNHTSHFELVIPQKGVIKLKHGQRITMGCTDDKNYLTATNSNLTYAACDGGETFKVVRKNIQFDDLKCKKTIRGGIRKMLNCGDRGRLTEIGYRITTRQWITLIKVCYDENKGDTLYTEHILHGEAIKYASKVTHRPSFSTEGLGPDIAASIAYKRAFQKSTFNKLLGSAQLAEKYINRTSFLARGHLSPAADFLYTTSQTTSYYLINTCPQWQVINGGNWKSLEIKIRKTAQKYNDTFTIITGTHGVLSLNDINNNEKDIYLVSENKLTVPKYIWKIVYNANSKLGIAFIVLNNPFAEITKQSGNICDLSGWISNSWFDISRGFVYCCDVNYLMNVIDSAPRLEVNGVLRGL